MTQLNIQKHGDVNRLLGGDETVHVILRPGVECILPTHLYDEDYAILQIGYDMPVPIPDLRITSEGFAATLSFKGKPFHCYVPWENVFAIQCPKRNLQAIYDSEAFAYSVSVATRRDAIRPPPQPARPSYLRVVDGGRKKSMFDNVQRGPLADRSHLRVVQD